MYVGLLPLKMVQKQQLVQNAGARLLPGNHYIQHIGSMLIQLHWLVAGFFHIQFKLLVLPWKSLNGLEPGYPRAEVSKQSPTSLIQPAGALYVACQDNNKKYERCGKYHAPAPDTLEL